MPYINAGFDQHGGRRSGPYELAAMGATVPVVVSFCPPHLAHLLEIHGLFNFETEEALAIVDTGSTYSCIDIRLAERLRLPEVDQASLAGVEGVYKTVTYAAYIGVPGLKVSKHSDFAGVRLSEGGFQHKVLLGRDFLRYLTMNYEGATGRVTIRPRPRLGTSLLSWLNERWP